MKKILSLILVVAMIFTLVACSGNDDNKNPIDNMENIAQSTQGTTENQESTEEGGNETISSENDNGGTIENTENVGTSTETDDVSGNDASGEITKPTKPADSTKPTETTKPNESTKPTENTKPVTHTHNYDYQIKITKQATCTENGTKILTCSCGDSCTVTISKIAHNWGEWKTTKEPTATAEGNSQRKCSSCGATENKSIAKLPSTTTKAYYVSHEIISVERPNTFYVGGVDILSKIYGKNTLQTGDIVKIKINMSDGGSDFTIPDTYNNGRCFCTYSVSGNIITIVVGDKTSSTLEIRAKDSSGENVTTRIFSTDVYNNCLATPLLGNAEHLLWEYAEKLDIIDWSDNGLVDSSRPCENVYFDASEYSNYIQKSFEYLDEMNTKGYRLFNILVTPWYVNFAVYFD